uniref:Uncharacterized protein n=1 Tax=Aegilops tauschii subsp. strangulata TaxID=200361 RepID=A0A452ZKU2_AEGTS
EWVYFLNSGSQIEVNCSVEPGTGLTNPLRITIAQAGKVGFTQWSEEPSVHGKHALPESLNRSCAVTLQDPNVPGLSKSQEPERLGRASILPTTTTSPSATCATKTRR